MCVVVKRVLSFNSRANRARSTSVLNIKPDLATAHTKVSVSSHP